MMKQKKNIPVTDETFVMLRPGEISQLAREIVIKTVEELRIKEQGENNSPVGIDEICERFHLSRNNVKSHKWRTEHAFPTFQKARGARVRFIPSEVNAWIKQHGRERISAATISKSNK